MPKKRTYNFKPIQGSSSSSNKPTPTQNDNNPGPSVNDRLNELRKLESKDAAARKRQLADSANQRSVPHELSRLLGVPESAPPKPKANVRTRERMRTPGPAPPKSWLAGGSSAWKSRKNADRSVHSRTRHLLRFSRLAGLEDDSIDEKPSSLVHLALKTIAESWDLLDEEDYPALSDIPLRLRLRMISYIGHYGSNLNIVGLKALLQGNEDIKCLDVAGLVGYGNLNLRKLANLLDHDQDDKLSQVQTVIADSWDADDSLETVLSPTIPINRFSGLTHLCLSNPSPIASWRELIAFSKNIPHVTHLSLAYWPRPTLTPNLSTATISSQHSPDVTAGGSHYYSALDQDMDEPASLIRQLSINLLCLQWLDLEGCEEWFPALGKLAVYNYKRESDGEWLGITKAESIFTSNWKNLHYIRCAQGWLPSIIGVQGQGERREATVIDMVVVDGVLRYLKQQDTRFEAEKPSQDVIDTERKKARIWLEREHGVNYACMRINALRRAQGVRPIEADFGWVRRHVAST